MTPDELREKIALTLVLVAQWRGHDKFSFVDTDKAADAVMLVLAEALAGKDAEIADLWRRVDAVAELLSAQHLRNRRLSALLRGMARRVGQIRRDAETNVGHLAHQADTLMDLTADLGHARTELEQERVRRQNLAALTAPDVFAAARLAEAEQTITEVRESETATRLRWSRRYRAARDHLAELRERAVVLPEDMDSQIHAALNESPHLSDFEALAALGIVARLIEHRLR